MNVHADEKLDGVIVPEKRPLSILCLEDKIARQAVVFVPEAIYEADFLGFCYGFRPARGPPGGPARCAGRSRNGCGQGYRRSRWNCADDGTDPIAKTGAFLTRCSRGT